MNKFVPIGIGAAVGIAVIISLLITLETPTEPEIVDEPEWVSSGPFSINKDKYRIGEKIAYSVQGLSHRDVGTILFVSPEGIVGNAQLFDGRQKCCFNQYWEPDTSVFTGLYKVEQLVGEWKLVFNGTNYAPIEFEITEERVRGSEAEIFDLDIPGEAPQIGPSLNQTG